MKELEGLLTEAADKLGKKEYPSELAGQLGGLAIPFDSTKVDGSKISGLKPSALRLLLKFSSGCEDLNDKKDSLKNLLDGVKPQIEKGWKEEKEPVVGFSVVFRSEQKGVIAELVQTKAPFDLSKDWPASYDILKPERTQQGIRNAEKKAARYVKGDLPGSGSDPAVIPLDPSTTAIFTSQEVLFRLRKAFLDLREELKGIHDSPNPDSDRDGLIDIGDKLVTEVQKVTTGG